MKSADLKKTTQGLRELADEMESVLGEAVRDVEGRKKEVEDTKARWEDAKSRWRRLEELLESV